MTPNNVILAGGTGFIGKYFNEHFTRLGYEVIIISRRTGINWNDNTGIIAALENSDLLINLAGKSVDCRYNQKNKAEIFNSRTETTRILGKAILQCKNPPALWINSSTATIYRHAEDRPMTESSGEIGSGFSVEVAEAWEKAFFDFKVPRTRQVALRTAIVLGKGGGALGPLIKLVKFGLGGTQGNGKQMVSWLHIKDLYNIVQFIQAH